MRYKVPIFVFVFAAAVTAGTYWLRLKATRIAGVDAPVAAELVAEDGSGPGSAEATSTATPGSEQARSATRSNSPAAVLGERSPETPEGKHEAYVAKRVIELQDLGMEDDPESLNTILSELDNEDPRIREAAVEAAVQFGNRDAIPFLIEAATHTNDPKERASILEAVEFLKLPTLAEALAPTNPPPASAPSGSRTGP